MSARNCEIHNCQLYSGQAEIMYGIWLPSRSPEYIEARQKLFPYSFLKIPGGNEYNPDFPKTRELVYCKMCREVESDWNQRIRLK